SKNENFRLALVDSFKQVLKNSLNLLGIETIDKM
ncbi:MAG: DALR anticodon-binding domain-containing protein, partial [Nanoarchaeota archaeon]